MKRLRIMLTTYRQSLLTAGLLAFILLIAVVAGGIARHKPPSGKDQLTAVTGSVGNLVILPKNETPTLATVSDSGKLKSQAIFANAENGDKVLVYAKAGEIIIYRPSIGKIVEIGPLILDKNGSPYVTSRIAIINGTGNAAALDAMTQAVVSAFPNATIVAKQPAPRIFPTSLAIDLTTSNQPLDEQIADTLSIKSGQLPLGIGSPANADILIIIGQDYSK